MRARASYLQIGQGVLLWRLNDRQKTADDGVYIDSLGGALQETAERHKLINSEKIARNAFGPHIRSACRLICNGVVRKNARPYQKLLKEMRSLTDIFILEILKKCLQNPVQRIEYQRGNLLLVMTPLQTMLQSLSEQIRIDDHVIW